MTLTDEQLEARVAELTDALEDVVWQYAGRIVKGRRRHIHDNALSAMEHAFDVLGYTRPLHDVHKITEGCDIRRCPEWDVAGWHNGDGRYVRVCRKHFSALRPDPDTGKVANLPLSVKAARREVRRCSECGVLAEPDMEERFHHWHTCSRSPERTQP